ncbi:hypothetical protein Pfo_015114 [Paulownia fortunei]|nr:hypothetical protein Pfo_015114 [Paulownia fortunei]
MRPCPRRARLPYPYWVTVPHLEMYRWRPGFLFVPCSCASNVVAKPILGQGSISWPIAKGIRSSPELIEAIFNFASLCIGLMYLCFNLMGQGLFMTYKRVSIINEEYHNATYNALSKQFIRKIYILISLMREVVER